MTESSTTPKVFISYSHSSPNRQEWVRNLAEKLMANGVDVVLDQWELEAGNDIYAYMEQMVSGEGINKVIIVCDTDYAQKADNRQKGVGAETQIITPKIYNKTNQKKFIPVLAEKDDKENSSIPAYCKNLLHIDLSNDEYESNFDNLLRAIYDQPVYSKPTLGKRPDFSSEKISPVSIISSSEVCNSLRHDKNDATGILEDYFSNIATNMEKFTIQTRVENYDHIIDSINNFLPYRDEIIKILSSIAIYSPKNENINKIHKFFEELIPYLTFQGSGSYYEEDFDNFKFIVQELFLYTVATLIKNERFEQVAYLMNNHYYVKIQGTNNSMRPFDCMRNYLRSFHNRNINLNLRRMSLHADIIKERTHSIITFEQIMQADFVLSLKSFFTNNHCRWFPTTLIYAEQSSFEIFGRSEKKAYFNKIKCLWNIKEPSELKVALQYLSQQLLLATHDDGDVFYLANYDKLCSIE